MLVQARGVISYKGQTAFSKELRYAPEQGGLRRWVCFFNHDLRLVVQFTVSLHAMVHGLSPLALPPISSAFFLLQPEITTTATPGAHHGLRR
jgi:hypothetical protein